MQTLTHALRHLENGFVSINKGRRGHYSYNTQDYNIIIGASQ